ncbi:hypothetical protein JCGZ_26638 [Jatropha curcas]|uniref:Uncharacterized protein n=1 Tax=Jatropha curcas TaxID=180498 RepID=A0A067JIU6_JATCU|nr:hypothetical protein JCGZ_26638 [Jatropha curcas]
MIHAQRRSFCLSESSPESRRSAAAVHGGRKRQTAQKFTTITPLDSKYAKDSIFSVNLVRSVLQLAGSGPTAAAPPSHTITSQTLMKSKSYGGELLIASWRVDWRLSPPLEPPKTVWIAIDEEERLPRGRQLHPRRCRSDRREGRLEL